MKRKCYLLRSQSIKRAKTFRIIKDRTKTVSLYFLIFFLFFCYIVTACAAFEYSVFWIFVLVSGTGIMIFSDRYIVPYIIEMEDDFGPEWYTCKRKKPKKAKEEDHFLSFIEV